MLEIRLLGRFSVCRGGDEIAPGAFGGRLVRTLLRILLTHGGAPVSSNTLAEALWPGGPPADPEENLRVLVKRACDVLGDASLIRAGPDGYRLVAPEGCTIDAETFLAHVGAGRERLAAGEPSPALDRFRLAIDAWGGEPLPEDAHAPWAREYRSRLGRAYVEALEGAATSALGVGQPQEAVAPAERAAVREPLRETAQLLWVRALAESGDTDAALAAFDAFRHRLATELGTEPSAEALQLRARIGQISGPAPGPQGDSAGGRRPRFDELAFVGRDEELFTILDVVSGTRPGAVAVSGPVGVGKSRLLSEVASRAQVPVVAAKAFLPEREEAWGLAKGLLRQALALDVEAARAMPDRSAQALASVLPELEDVRPVGTAPLDPESRRALVMEGGVRLIGAAARTGLLMAVDNLQWADPTSLALLGHAIGRVDGLRLLGAYRPDELVPDAPLTSFLQDLPSIAEVETVELDPFREDTVADLVTDEELVRVLSDETDRTPLAITEVIRDLVRQGVLEPDPGGGWRSTSAAAAQLARELARAGQRKAIQTRGRHQGPGPRHLLHLLSVLGRGTSARLLAEASGSDQGRVLDDLDVLARARLVRLGDEGWATADDLTGEAVAEGLGRPELARLHHALAQVLAGQGADAAEVARHLEGSGDREGAAACYAEAARDRIGRRALTEAERLADAGLRLGPTATVRSDLLESRAEGRVHRGDIAGAREDLRTALDDRPGGPERSRILTRMAELTSGSEDYARAVELAELAIAEAGSDQRARAQALAAAAILDINTGRMDRGQERAGEAMALFEQLGDSLGVARIMDVGALGAFVAGDLRAAEGIFERVARLFEDAGQLLRVREPRVNRALSLALLGRGAEALPEIDAALELERALGRPEGEAYCLWARSETTSDLGRLDEAKANAETAVATARSVGHREWESAALCALGGARRASGDLEGAEAAARQAVELAGGDFTFAYVAARLASILVDKGDLAAAESILAQASAASYPIFDFELALLRGRIALLRDEPDAEAMAGEALSAVEAQGMVGMFSFGVVKQMLSERGGRGPGQTQKRRERKTFMFTDIVGSTNLVEALGDEAWEHLLRWHDQALRSLFVQHQGVEVKQIGDGFFIAFDTPAPAIECAVSIQRALTKHRKEQGFAPQVRIGIHETEATRKGDDYQGTGVHLAARVGALAKGGEILASQSTVPQACELPVSEPRSVTLKGYATPTPVVAIDWR